MTNQQLQTDVKEGINYLKRNCVQQKMLIQKHPTCNFEMREDLFFQLCKAIVSQQLSTKAAATIFERWVTSFNGKLTPNKVLKLTDEQFQNCGVSRQKRSYIRNIADYWNNNKAFIKNINRQSNEAIIKELSSIKGVGEWTVQMLLMFSMGRLNVYPIKDLGILRGLQKVYGLPEKPTKKDFEKVATAWGNYASIACWYLWRSLED